jgi:mRNA interferase RelE/StbE
MQVAFKKTFFKDLQRLPPEIQSKVQQTVFVEIPAIDSLNNLHNAKKLRGFENYYRLRIGVYRLGFKYENSKITFYRILHRKEIYRYFP